MYIIALAASGGFSPEAWNAIIVALVGSFGTFVVARYTAKLRADRDDSDDGSRFRGELRDDNVALRQELRDVKEERDRIKERLFIVEEELYKLQKERRGRQAADNATENRASLDENGPIRREREARQAADLATDIRQNMDLSDPEGERNLKADKIVQQRRDEKK